MPLTIITLNPTSSVKDKAVPSYPLNAAVVDLNSMSFVLVVEEVAHHMVDLVVDAPVMETVMDANSTTQILTTIVKTPML